ncbi:glycoside hydrolase superfamily [Hypoxylon sp. NC1633]|nr:glycoside hydrolase superfamily [Hypoxylon sp. NC1633]
MRSFIFAVVAFATASAAATLDWTAAYQKANASLAKLSQNDKINIVTGVGWNKGPCVGNTAAAGSISYPQLCLQDGPLGVRYATGVNAFVPGIQVAATWDRALIRERGQFMAEETKGCGVHVLLGPVAGPLGKNPTGGRNWEGFGADPYLQGIAMAETIEGMQSVGVQANAKHYILNEQELNRETMSSNVDDRTIHELYLWPFADAVHANVASVMCSYNKINGTWACENPYIMDTLLKKQLGFRGYVMTDWNAQHSTGPAATAGLDMTMPGSDFNGGSIFWGSKLSQAVSSGQVPQARIDDMVRRVLAAWYLLGQDSGYPAINLRANVQGQHKTNIRATARDGIVLLKNEEGILPLKSPGKLGLVGSAAVVNPQGMNSCTDQGCNTGALGMGWGSGTASYPYFSAPADAIKARAQTDGTQISMSASDSTGSVSSAVSGADAAIVFITSDSGEGYITVENNAGDRNNLDPWHNGNELVKAVAAASDNVIVVVHSVGPVILETILAQPNVKAIVWAGLPSQENGNALVDILYGAANPSGKLPYTIAKSAVDYGTSVSGSNDNFKESFYVDYRKFDNDGIEPRYEFGYGLSYTNFTYSNIFVDGRPTSGPATGEIIPGGRADLWETVLTVTVTLANTGSVQGAEVAQLYIGFPESANTPPKQLRGFEKLALEPGAENNVAFELKRRDLSIWNTASQEWEVPSGTFNISVGSSSRDIRQTGTLENSQFNSALKQSTSIKRDLAGLSCSDGNAPTPAAIGSLSASLTAFSRTLDEYNTLSKQELNPAKQEKAYERIKNFRTELSSFRSQLDEMKSRREDALHTQNRSELLGRRPFVTATPENPYANTPPQQPSSPSIPLNRYGNGGQLSMGSNDYTRETHALREQNFFGATNTALDDYIARGQAVLGDLGAQRDMLKNTQKRLYSVANTLGVSGDTIRMVERRAREDKWIFGAGVVIFFAFCWLCLHFLR